MDVVTCSASSIAGINNFGDELLTELYHKWISACADISSVRHLSVSPYGLLTPESQQQLESSSLLVFTGGGYFADGDIESHHSARRHLRALRNRSVYGGVFKRAQKFGVPCAVLGLEVGPLANPFYRSVVTEILLAARNVVVRNEESREYAANLCGRKDLAVHMDGALAVTAEFYTMRPASESDPEYFNIGLHLHSITGDTSWADLVAYTVAQLPADRQARLHYIHDQRKRDRHPSRSMRAEQAISDVFPGVVSIPYRNPADTLQQLDTIELLITSKLHMGIVARSLGIPVMAIGAHPKIRRFYSTMGEDDSCGLPEEFVSRGLPAPVTACLSRGAQARIPVRERFTRSASENQAVVRRLIESLG